jgi:D-serine dehydratase
MSHCSPSYVDMLFITNVDKSAPCELSVVVGDDHVHDPIPVYNLLLMNSTAASELAVATSLGLIHLVNLSIMMNKWSKPSRAGGSFLT